MRRIRNSECGIVRVETAHGRIDASQYKKRLWWALFWWEYMKIAAQSGCFGDSLSCTLGKSVRRKPQVAQNITFSGFIVLHVAQTHFPLGRTVQRGFGEDEADCFFVRFKVSFAGVGGALLEAPAQR